MILFRGELSLPSALSREILNASPRALSFLSRARDVIHQVWVARNSLVVERQNLLLMVPMSVLKACQLLLRMLLEPCIHVGHLWAPGEVGVPGEGHGLR